VTLIDTFLNAVVPYRAAKAAKAKADSNNFSLGLKRLIGSRAFIDAGKRTDLPTWR
jgi:hypothetical protein